MEDVEIDLSILPDDWIETILGYLPVSALLNAEKVCSKWEILCNNVWKSKRELRFIGKFDYDDYEAALHRCGEFITLLHVERQPCVPNQLVDHGRELNYQCVQESSKIIIPIACYCKNLEHLSLDLCHVNRIAFSSLHKCTSPRLVSFHLKGFRSEILDDDFGMILAKSTNLESLVLSKVIFLQGESFSKISNECKFLDISYCLFASHLPSDVLMSLTNLESLRVAGVDEIKPLISQFSAIYPNLKELDLSDIRRVTDSDLTSLLFLQNLKFLTVNRLECVTSGIVISVAETFKSQLELFHCAGCQNVTNSSFCRMIELCPKLRSLNVTSCELISSSFLVEASFALRERKNKIPLEILTSLHHEDFPENRRKMLRTEAHPLLVIKYC